MRIDQFQAIFDQAAVGIKILDLEGHLLNANRKVCDILGYQLHELIGRNFLEMTFPADLPQERLLLSRLLGNEISSYSLEKRYLRKDGTTVWVRATSSLTASGSGPRCRISVIEDISERKQAEEARRASEARLQTVLEAIPIGAILASANGRVMEANKAYLDLVGRTKEDLHAGRVRWDDITPPEWFAADERAIAEARARGISSMYEKEYICHGKRVPVLLGLASVNGGDHFAIFVLDLSERRAAAQALQTRTAEWEALIETAPVAVWFSYDKELREVRANRFASELLGLPRVYSQAESLDETHKMQRLNLFKNGFEIPADRYPLRRAMRGEDIRGEECEARCADGRKVTLLCNSSALRDADGTIIGAISTAADITARKESEAAFQEREARLRSILETVPEALITISETGAIESFSRSAEFLFGYSASEVIGRNVSVLMPSPYREEHDQYLSKYLRTGERRIIGIGQLVSGQRKDGSVFPMELAVGEVKLDDRYLFTGFIRDLTAAQKIEQELRQAHKMEAVGQLTGGIAHDFNNLLTVILGNLEMLETRMSGAVQKDPMQLDLVKEAREMAEYGAQLTERLLAFGRKQPLQPRLTDVGELIGEMTPLLRRTLGEAIRVRGHSDNDLWKVLIDPSQLQNAILNLAINARDAMPAGGKLTITAENTELDPDYARMYPDLQPGRYVLISVTDTGAGMQKNIQERAFEPFFTTKDVGAGSGLGLPMVYGFVKQSSGHVTLYSEPSHGTTICMYLPRATVTEDEVEVQPEPPLDSFRGQGETVLLVEDDPRVRQMTFTRLENLGYHAIDAANGPAALALFEAYPRIDLLFTDMVMPGGMSGSDLASAVRAKRPDIKVLFTSGYAEPDLILRERAKEAGWLKKPYSTLELARRLRAILG